MVSKILKFSIKKLSRTLVDKFSCIEILYLFGSSRDGEVKKGSDIDVGIFINSSVLKKNPLIGLEIEVYLQELLKCSVDVVIMNKANSVLRYEVLNTGKRIFEKDSDKRRLNELCFIKDYFDVKYYQQKRNGYGQ